jgi:flagellar FliL protein
MATATATADAAPAKGKSKLLVILVAVFGLLAAGGGGAAFFFHKKAADSEAAAKDDEAGDDAKSDKKKKSKKDAKPPVFNTLENFTVNLSGEGDHFMQLGVVLQLKDEETSEKVKAFLPLIRSKVLLLASSKTAEELQTQKGKQDLVAEILEATRAPLKEDGEDVQAVLLGGMLIQ